MLPATVSVLQEIISAPSATADDFEKAVLTDPVLTACVLQAANSLNPACAPIGTVREAIEKTGMQQLYDMAVGSTIRRTLPSRIPGYGITAGKFWIHCIAVATIADLLARKLKLANHEQAFTAGLLHDIGQLVIGNFLAHAMPAADWWTFDTPAKERSLLGCNHCDVGYEVAVRWNLPDTVRDCCRWHHEINRGLETTNSDLLTVIHAADALSYMIGFPGVGYVGEVLDKDAPKKLGFSARELYELASTVKQVIGRNAVATGMGPSGRQA